MENLNKCALLEVNVEIKTDEPWQDELVKIILAWLK